MKKLMLIFGMVAAFALGGAAAFAGNSDKPASPPGRGDCEHGNSQKPCRDDPQPDRGKDCEEHGNQGGVNEDHCAGETTPVVTDPGVTTDPVVTVPVVTDPVVTNPIVTNPVVADPVVTDPVVTDSDSKDTVAAPATETADTKTVPQENRSKVAPSVRVLGATVSKAAPRGVVARPATAPTKAPQAPPFTP